MTAPTSGGPVDRPPRCCLLLVAELRADVIDSLDEFVNGGRQVVDAVSDVVCVL